jgi:hypothetical protein
VSAQRRRPVFDSPPMPDPGAETEKSKRTGAGGRGTRPECGRKHRAGRELGAASLSSTTPPAERHRRATALSQPLSNPAARRRAGGAMRSASPVRLFYLGVSFCYSCSRIEHSDRVSVNSLRFSSASSRHSFPLLFSRRVRSRF